MMTRFGPTILGSLIVMLSTLIGCGGGNEEAAVENSQPTDPSADTASIYLDLHQTLTASLGRNEDALYDADALEWTPESLEQNQSTIQRLIDNTRAESCTFPIDLTEPHNLPHFGAMRTLSKILQTDAYRCLNANDTRGAAQRVAAIIRLARHMAEEGQTPALTKLTGFAIVGLATFVAEEYVDWFSNQDRAIIGAELKRIDLANPFNIIASVEIERQILVEMIPQRQEIILMDDDLRFTTWTNTLTEQEQASLIANIDYASREVVRLWYAPDAVDRLRQLPGADDDGPLGQMIDTMPSIREKASETAATIRSAIELLNRL